MQRVKAVCSSEFHASGHTNKMKHRVYHIGQDNKLTELLATDSIDECINYLKIPPATGIYIMMYGYAMGVVSGLSCSSYPTATT